MTSHTATIEVDLDAVRSNYHLLQQWHARQAVSSVVKADAYGLGMEEVSRALWLEGCRIFFVAHLAEGVLLRSILPEAGIGVFSGLLPNEAPDYLHHRLVPVLNTPGQVEYWEAAAQGKAVGILHVDTGMNRLGLSQTELLHIVSRHPMLVGQQIQYVMSHLACANEPGNPRNALQLARFHEALKLLPGVQASLANSAGLFLSSEYHFDLARPGCALYGINPANGRNPMKPVARLSSPILQLRTLEQDDMVGYGATYKAKKGSRIAITALGYADGWLRTLSNKGFAYVEGHKVPMAGRVSMDMVALDVTKVPEALITPQSRAEFINKEYTVDDVAAAADTIGYEVFTRLGNRVQRLYRPL